MRMRTFLFAFIAVFAAVGLSAQGETKPFIEVTGSATVSIVPDRITVEVGMEEYFEHRANGDSTLVRLSAIEKDVMKVLRSAGVSDSMIVVSDLGNYRNRDVSSTFLMAKRLKATLTDFNQMEKIAERLDHKGIVSFIIAAVDNSDMAVYNRRGLKAALDAARDKAEFIAQNEGLKIAMPCEIIENGPNYYESPSFSNVSLQNGSGMENMRRIVRRYSVKVRYVFTPLTE
mgnify:CR=1 FL=1